MRNLAASEKLGTSDLDDTELAFGFAESGASDTQIVQYVPFPYREGYRSILSGQWDIRVFEPSVTVDVASESESLVVDTHYNVMAYSDDTTVDTSLLVTTVPSEEERDGRALVQFVNLNGDSTDSAYTFVIDSDGVLTEVTVARGHTSGYRDVGTIDEADIRVVDEDGNVIAEWKVSAFEKGESYSVVFYGADDEGSADYLPDDYPAAAVSRFRD